MMGTIGRVMAVEQRIRRPGNWISFLLVALAWFTAGLALTRLLYEGLFPQALWLARPFPVFLIASFVAILGWFVWRAVPSTLPPSSFLPLLLNLIFLFDPQVDLARSRLFFAAGVWLTAVFLARSVAKPHTWRWLGVLFVIAALLPLYLLTMPHTVGRADTFEFQVVAPQLGIVHPTGYPLYLLLGKLWTLLLPFGSVAWRLNVGTAVYALVAVCLVYLTAFDWLKRPVPALLGAAALGISPTFGAKRLRPRSTACMPCLWPWRSF